MGKTAVKILYLDHAPYEGGAEVSLKELVAHLNGDRFERAVVAPLRAPYAANFREAGVQHMPFTYHFKSYGLLLPLLWDLLQLATLVRRFQPDIIHANTRVTNILGGLLYWLGFFPGAVKLLNHVRDKDPLPGWKLKLLGACDQIVANSGGVRDFLVEGGIDVNMIEIIYNGVDLTQFQARDREERGSSQKTLTFIGQIYPRKGLKYLFQALAEVKKQVPGVVLQVVGQDPDEGEVNIGLLKELAIRLDLGDSIHWLGYREDIPEILFKTDVFVLPSLEEPFGRVLIEAMAMEVPVVATRVGGIPEIVEDGKTGLLVDPQDSGQLAEKVVELLQDVKLREQLGQEGRRRVRGKFSLKRHVEKVEKTYDRLVNA